MVTENPMRGVPIPLSDLRPLEWVQLTLGFFWRGIAWSLVSGLIGSLMSYAVAFGVWAALGQAPAPETYNRIALPLTLLLGLLVSLVMLRWFVRMVLAGRYGHLRLAVIRDHADPAIARRPV
jgi:hypothetical protein